jgi:hypothetical protein
MITARNKSLQHGYFSQSGVQIGVRSSRYRAGLTPSLESPPPRLRAQRDLRSKNTSKTAGTSMTEKLYVDKLARSKNQYPRSKNTRENEESHYSKATYVEKIARSKNPKNVLALIRYIYGNSCYH